MSRLLCFLVHTVHAEEPPSHSTILPTASLPTETPLPLPVLPPPPPLRPPTNSLPALPSHYSPSSPLPSQAGKIIFEVLRTDSLTDGYNILVEIG